MFFRKLGKVMATIAVNGALLGMNYKSGSGQGQSAGAMSIQSMLLSERCKGLFSRDIMLSRGGKFPSVATPKPVEERRTYWLEVMREPMMRDSIVAPAPMAKRIPTWALNNLPVRCVTNNMELRMIQRRESVALNLSVGEDVSLLVLEGIDQLSFVGDIVFRPEGASGHFVFCLTLANDEVTFLIGQLG